MGIVGHVSGSVTTKSSKVPYEGMGGGGDSEASSASILSHL